MSNLELRIEEEANLGLTISESSDMSFDAVDFVGVPFAPTVEVEDIEGGHRVSITSMGAEGKKTDEFDVMDGADGATGPQGPKGDSYEITAADYAEIAKVVEEDIQDVIDAAQDAADDATAAAAEARAASAATWLSGNVLFGELSEAAVLTTDDAFAAPPKGVEVYGKSTQDGTPTPDAPQEIKSVDDCVLNIAGFNLFDISKVDTSVHTVNGTTITAGGSTAFHDFYSGAAMTSTKTYTVDDVAKMLHLPAGTYTLKVASASNAISCYYVDPNTRKTGKELVWNVTQKTFVLEKAGYVALAVRYAGSTVTNLQINAGTIAHDYTPYQCEITSVQVLDQSLRSLPDGTRDTLTLSYVGPSTEHEGWGVYSKTLVQNVGEVTLDGTESWTAGSGAGAGTYYTQCDAIQRATNYDGILMCDTLECKPRFQSVKNLDAISAYSETGYDGQNWIYACATTVSSAAEMKQFFVEHPTTLQYILATPITHDLGTVELPILPNPLTAWADGGSAQPTMQIEYERALNIVIPRIEAAISDLATS